jgi:hypothetical protein
MFGCEDCHSVPALSSGKDGKSGEKLSGVLLQGIGVPKSGCYRNTEFPSRLLKSCSPSPFSPFLIVAYSQLRNILPSLIPIFTRRTNGQCLGTFTAVSLSPFLFVQCRVCRCFPTFSSLIHSFILFQRTHVRSTLVLPSMLQLLTYPERFRLHP